MKEKEREKKKENQNSPSESKPPRIQTPLPPPFTSRMGDVMSQPGNKPVILKLIAYSLLMFLVPIITYFFVNENIGKLIDVPPNRAYLYGAAASIITVHIVIASYIISAFREKVHDD